MERELPHASTSVTVHLQSGQQAAFLQLVEDFHSGRVRAIVPAVEADKPYVDVASDLFRSPTTSPMLKSRIAADERRDPADALGDAELLHVLQAKRFAEAVQPGAFELPGDDIHRVGVEALRRLYKVAHGHSGQCRHVARFLLGLYNGDRFPFDLTDFRCLDNELFEDCMRVLRMDARSCKQEVHTYFEHGGERWEDLAERWGVVEVARLKSIARGVIDRQLSDYCGRISKLVDVLKSAMRYREPRDDE